MDEIFKYFIKRPDDVDSKKRVGFSYWFTANFPAKEFNQDERLFWEFMKFCSELNEPIDMHHLDVWISSDLRPLLKEINVKVPGCESLSFNDPISFETAVQTTAVVLKDDLTILSSLDANTDNFKVDMKAWIGKKADEKTIEALTNTYNIYASTESGVKERDYAMKALSEIAVIYDDTKLEDLGESVNSIAQEDGRRLITDTGIPAIDSSQGGLREGQMFGIQASTGAGKTRFVLGTYVYRALTMHRSNTLFLALEQDKIEVENMLLAHHIFKLFGIVIHTKLLNDNTVPEEYQAKVEAARLDLFHSGKYGKFYCKSTNLYIEDIAATIDSMDKLQGPFDFVVIDYMGLIKTRSPRMYGGRYEWIADSYTDFKNYLRRTRKGGIAIGQFNSEGDEAGKADKPILTSHAQGGVGIYRSSDGDLALSYTPQMGAQNMRRVSQVKIRDGAPMPKFLVKTSLGICYFEQELRKDV